MNPDQLAASGSESGHQKALFAWAAMSCRFGYEVADDMEAYSSKTHNLAITRHNKRQIYDLEWLHSIPNGGLRDPKTAALMKAEGVRKGIGDIFLPTPKDGHFHGLYIEMKTATGKQSLEQLEFERHCKSRGFIYEVCKSWREAAKIIKWYLPCQ